MTLEGSRCLVAGASSGIGAAIAARLAKAGARVVGAARRFEGEPAMPEPGRVVEARLDVTRAADVTACVAAIDPVDLVVCSAGVASFGPASDMDDDALRAMLEVHVVGTHHLCRAVAPGMRDRGSGHIAIIGSIAGRGAEVFSDCAGYAAAKAGQHAYARTLAAELRPRGVAVSLWHVGAVDTPLWDARPGFDRAAMMQPAELAELFVTTLARPGARVDEIVVTPPDGAM